MARFYIYTLSACVSSGLHDSFMRWGVFLLGLVFGVFAEKVPPPHQRTFVRCDCMHPLPGQRTPQPLELQRFSASLPKILFLGIVKPPGFLASQNARQARSPKIGYLPRENSEEVQIPYSNLNTLKTANRALQGYGQICKRLFGCVWACSFLHFCFL